MKALNLTLRVVPRTKKTSQRICSFGRPCPTCKARPFKKVLPSEAFEEMEAQCLEEGHAIRAKVEAIGETLPIESPVRVTARFFRDADRGDATGYYQALADILQEPRWKEGKLIRRGMGIIRDDSQIVDWDGSRLFVDKQHPRIEVRIEVLEPGLF